MVGFFFRLTGGGFAVEDFLGRLKKFGHDAPLGFAGASQPGVFGIFFHLST